VRWLLQQLVDLAAYWLFPFLCFLLPARAANAMARFVTRQSWLFRTPTRNALANASMVMTVPDPSAWMTTTRLVRFLDAVDTWHGRFSSDRRIARSLITGPKHWPEATNLVFLGTHLGPGTLFLRAVAAAGYTPRFVFRDIPDIWRRSAPVYHAYLRFRIAYLRKVCRGQEIRVPGGAEAVAGALTEPGCALVLLSDAPAERPTGTVVSVFGRSLMIDPRGLGMAVERRATAVFFTVYWDAASSRRVIEVSEPKVLEDRDATLSQMEAHLGSLLERHPDQWQLWTTAQPVLAEAD
jgi:lauroyl/myristoyl acyltransferase